MSTWHIFTPTLNKVYKLIQRHFYLSVSLCSPPKATTVLMEDRTSSATAPADAYAFCSLTVNVATI